MVIINLKTRINPNTINWPNHCNHNYPNPNHSHNHNHNHNRQLSILDNRKKAANKAKMQAGMNKFQIVLTDVHTLINKKKKNTKDDDQKKQQPQQQQKQKELQKRNNNKQVIINLIKDYIKTINTVSTASTTTTTTSTNINNNSTINSSTVIITRSQCNYE